MGRLITELGAFVRAGGPSIYSQVHYSLPIRHDPDEDSLKFLDSVMDEARLRHADRYAASVLDLLECRDLRILRRGVLRRESSSLTDYLKQRDHSAHTLYNYFLGWYIFSAFGDFNVEFRRHCDIRGIIGEIHTSFFELWPYASLLHDIGYLFEGTLSPLDPSTLNERVGIGADVVQEFFQYWFFASLGFASDIDKKILLDLAKIESIPTISSRMTQIAGSLVSLGDCEKLRVELDREIQRRGLVPVIPANDCVANYDAFPCDAFDLWTKNYNYYGFANMASRVACMKLIFDRLISEGIADTGQRVIDHGVCSGLLLLNYYTLFMRIKAALPGVGPNINRRIILQFQNNRFSSRSKSDFHFWWAGISWATAAAAIHDVQTKNTLWQEPHLRLEKLKLSDDPLAYLGILVDCVQLWDRASVIKSPIIGGDLPIQNSIVDINYVGRKVEVKFNGNPGAESSARKELDNALDHWEDIVILTH